MRSTLINIVLTSNVDLSPLSNSRITFTHVGENRYRITSTFRVWKCQEHDVISRFLKRHLTPTGFYGNASKPSGYDFEIKPVNPIKKITTRIDKLILFSQILNKNWNVTTGALNSPENRVNASHLVEIHQLRRELKHKHGTNHADYAGYYSL
ncbi:MAG: hypothetical protein BWK73_10470 [Thiothrix lacustris]|uniref:Uncharacterized protein n=1 Tax=Thiothrix lacustris TaxID=525917 RepID=A0A1Y1QUP6_9GAMM|nr:MAG: hypothetical protein BWK73_10470 [Thiothrix lacustris]